MIEKIKRTTLTVEETATMLGISKDLIYTLVRESAIPHVRIGSRILFNAQSIQNWLNEEEKKHYIN